MTDVVSKKVRSRMMAGIGPAHTQPEIAIRKLLHRAGFRFRLHDRELPGRPDIILRKHRAVIFVHGCFWHRHQRCRFCTSPASNTEFWTNKFASNVERDRRNQQELLDHGWRVLVVWECAVKSSRTGKALQYRLKRWLESTRRQGEISSSNDL
jgi:DNA mismatch endonuclease (patch repair protein)